MLELGDFLTWPWIFRTWICVFNSTKNDQNRIFWIWFYLNLFKFLRTKMEQFLQRQVSRWVYCLKNKSTLISSWLYFRDIKRFINNTSKYFKVLTMMSPKNYSILNISFNNLIAKTNLSTLQHFSHSCICCTKNSSRFNMFSNTCFLIFIPNSDEPNLRTQKKAFKKWST